MTDMRLIDADELKRCIRNDGMFSDYWVEYLERMIIDRQPTVDLPEGSQRILSTIPLEGNGQRPSHKGCGYGEENDPMYTLNVTEVHAVACMLG